MVIILTKGTNSEASTVTGRARRRERGDRSSTQGEGETLEGESRW